MRRLITFATMAVLLSVGAAASAVEMMRQGTGAQNNIQNGRLQPLSPGEAQEQLGKIEVQNLVERQRIEKLSSASRNEVAEFAGSGPYAAHRGIASEPTLEAYHGKFIQLSSECVTVQLKKGPM